MQRLSLREIAEAHERKRMQTAREGKTINPQTECRQSVNRRGKTCRAHEGKITKGHHNTSKSQRQKKYFKNSRVREGKILQNRRDHRKHPREEKTHILKDYSLIYIDL